jgi:hypothetical protein
MATKLVTFSEIATASAFHGLLTYIGTNLGKIYKVVNSTGAMTLLDSVDAKIVSMSINHPTLYVTTSKGEIYTYTISATSDPYLGPTVGANSNAYGSGVPLTRSGATTAGTRIYSDDGGAVLYGTGSVPDIRGSLSRTLLTIDQTGGDIRVHALMGQLKAYNAMWNDEVVSAVHGRMEIVRAAGTVTLGGNGVTAAVLGIANTEGAVTVNTNHVLAGVCAMSDFKATLTQTGKTVAFLAGAYDTTNWSDATARTTWGYGLYVPVGAVTYGAILIGASTSAPLVFTSTGTTNVVDINAKLTAVSGTIRGLVSFVEFSGVNVGATTNVYAIRGYAKVSGTAAGSNTFYTAGVQGKIELSGTISGGKHAAVLGQLNASAGLAAATGGTVYCVWADGMQLNAAPNAALNVVGLGIEMPDGTKSFTSAIYAYGKADYLFDLQGPTTDYLATVATAPAAATGSIKINTPSGVRYILITDDPTA